MTNILIADDHDLVRDTIAAYLETVDGFHTFTAPNLDTALEFSTGQDVIDLLILDYHMPGMQGLEGISRGRKTFPHAKIILLSGVANRDVASSAMSKGVDGFIPKSLTAPSLVNAIKFVLSGERYFPFEFDPQSSTGSQNSLFKELSVREMQTLEQLCIGLSNKEIARNLGVQEVTIKLHVKNLLAKLGVTNRTQVALLAKEHHIF